MSEAFDVCLVSKNINQNLLDKMGMYLTPSLKKYIAKNSIFKKNGIDEKIKTECKVFFKGNFEFPAFSGVVKFESNDIKNVVNIEIKYVWSR